MRDSRLRVALWVGSSYGALVFGGTISLLHLFYNRLSSFQDAIVLWLFLGLLFGIPCALVCGGLTAGRILVDRKEHRNKAETGLDTALAGPLTCAPRAISQWLFCSVLSLWPDLRPTAARGAP